MSSAAEVHLAHLAQQLHRLRTERAWSLGQLAARSGIAKATLFKIEHRRTNPTLDTISALAVALAVPLVDLIGVPAVSAVEVVRSRDRHGSGRRGRGGGDDGGGEPGVGEQDTLVKSMLSGTLHVEIHRADFTPGPPAKAMRQVVGGWEHIVVLSGRLRVGPIGDIVELRPGDYAMYPADTVHTYEVVGRSTARAWIIVSRPRSSATRS